MALNTSVQDAGLKENKHHITVVITISSVICNSNNYSKCTADLTGMIPGETSLSGQMYLMMIMIVTYQVPITLRVLQIKQYKCACVI